VILWGHPGIQAQRDRIGSPEWATAYRTPASTRLLHACRCAAGRCCRAAAAQRPSRRRCHRRAGSRRRSGFPRCARSGDRRMRSTWRWISTSLRFLIWATLVSARGSSTESQYSAGRGASGAGAGAAGPRTNSAASFSICLGVGMRQLAGRSVILELEHKENESRVPLGLATRKNDPVGKPIVSEPATAVRLESEPPKRSSAYHGPPR
jgi:hypothetical protein